MIYLAQGRFQEFVQEGLKFFLFPGGAQHPLGPENPLKSLDFTGPGGLSPNSPPPEYASELAVHFNYYRVLVSSFS